MGFKEDADFARFVSMGAVGAAAVAERLRNEHGHQPVELERYAMANKIWQTKVKRLRLPDLLCLRCGLRIEARAKSALGVVLSHSDTPGREWDAGGMRDRDLFAFIKADLSTFPPMTGEPVFFSRAALRAAAGAAKRSAPKAATAGSEVTLTWPSWIPKKDGVLVGVDADGRIVWTADDGRTSAYWQWRSWSERHLYLAPGDRIRAHETVVAGVAAALDGGLACPGDTWELVLDLAHGSSAEDKFAAAKAVGLLGRMDLVADLGRMATDADSDWRLRLEVWAALTRLGERAWIPEIRGLALDDSVTLDRRMEAVFVLSEIPTNDAAGSLVEVAGAHGDGISELRAAAAWALGQGSAPSAERLLPLTVCDDDLVSLHAIVAMPDLPDDLHPGLIEWLAHGNEREAATAKALFVRHRAVTPSLPSSCETVLVLFLMSLGARLDWCRDVGGARGRCRRRFSGGSRRRAEGNRGRAQPAGA